MATQTGSIDLSAINGVKLYAAAGFENAEETYATKTELETTADGITSTVSETYATKSDVGAVSQRVSSLQQTADDFEVRFSGIDATIDEMDGTIDGLATQDDLANLANDSVSKSGDAWTSWFHAGVDSGNDPYLEMGQSGNDFNARYTNKSLSFRENDTELARLSGEEGLVAPIVRSGAVYVGSWIIEELDAGDLAIKLVGGA